MQTERTFNPLAFSTTETARHRSLGRTTIYNLINNAHLKPSEIGRRNLVTMASIQALVGCAGYHRAILEPAASYKLGAFGKDHRDASDPKHSPDERTSRRWLRTMLEVERGLA
jgi:hypothetical protein